MTPWHGHKNHHHHIHFRLKKYCCHCLSFIIVLNPLRIILGVIYYSSAFRNGIVILWPPSLIESDDEYWYWVVPYQSLLLLLFAAVHPPLLDPTDHWEWSCCMLELVLTFLLTTPSMRMGATKHHPRYPHPLSISLKECWVLPKNSTEIKIVGCCVVLTLPKSTVNHEYKPPIYWEWVFTAQFHCPLRTISKWVQTTQQWYSTQNWCSPLPSRYPTIPLQKWVFTIHSNTSSCSNESELKKGGHLSKSPVFQSTSTPCWDPLYSKRDTTLWPPPCVPVSHYMKVRPTGVQAIHCETCYYQLWDLVLLSKITPIPMHHETQCSIKTQWDRGPGRSLASTS